MSKLDELIKELCPNGVEWKKIRDISKVMRGKRLTKKELDDNAQYPVFHGGLEPLGYYSQYNRNADTTMIINVGASAGTVGYSSVDFWSSDGCYCIEKNNCLNDRYLYYVLSKDNNYFVSKVRYAGIPTLDAKIIENFDIPFPPLPVQSEIVRILDNFTELTVKLTVKLTAELTDRKKQYEYYRDSLLSFGDEVEWKTLEECVLKASNIKWVENKENDYKYIDLSSVNRDDNEIYETQTICSENAPSRAQQIVFSGDVIFGSTRPMLKRYCLVPDEYDNQICSTGFCVLRANPNLVLPRWIFYNVSTSDFYSYVEKNQKGASYPAITDKEVKAYKIPFLPIPEQKRIVDILDRFDTLCKDITSGLPAEIDERQKQYEYYRDKLLTFEKLDVEV